MGGGVTKLIPTELPSSPCCAMPPFQKPPSPKLGELHPQKLPRDILGAGTLGSGPLTKRGFQTLEGGDSFPARGRVGAGAHAASWGGVRGALNPASFFFFSSLTTTLGFPSSGLGQVGCWLPRPEGAQGDARSPEEGPSSSWKPESEARASGSQRRPLLAGRGARFHQAQTQGHAPEETGTGKSWKSLLQSVRPRSWACAPAARSARPARPEVGFGCPGTGAQGRAGQGAGPPPSASPGAAGARPELAFGVPPQEKNGKL